MSARAQAHLVSEAVAPEGLAGSVAAARAGRGVSEAVAMENLVERMPSGWRLRTEVLEAEAGAMVAAARAEGGPAEGEEAAWDKAA